MKDTVRVRFAPSPTGFLHIGGLRTALYNYLFARHHSGKFILRIEDTDQSRFIEDAEQDIIDSLEWSGIKIDEGPKSPGDFGPYRQSERKEIYRKYAKELIEKGTAYYAFDTTTELDQMRDRLQKSGNPSPKYDAITRQSMINSLTLPKAELQKLLDSGAEYVIRMKVPRRETIRFEDLIRGKVSFDSEDLDDQVLLKSDGMPTYHLANVVDDHLMNITHVIRGEEWLSSTPKHVILYHAFGWDTPKMAHLPLIMSPNGGKLSKRNAESEGIPINTKYYKEKHYEPEAVINFLTYLGWNPGDNSEIHSMDELCRLFTLDRVSKGGAVFNHDKLLWYNIHYLHEQTDLQLAARIKSISEKDFILNADDKFLAKVIDLVKEKVSKLEELLEKIITIGSFFFEEPESYNEDALKKWQDDSAELVSEYRSKIHHLADDAFKAGILKQLLGEVIHEKDVGLGKLMMPLRIAVTGQGFGPDLFTSMELIGKTPVLRRIDLALEKLN